jgi:hypothetical protein
MTRNGIKHKVMSGNEQKLTKSNNLRETLQPPSSLISLREFDEKIPETRP